MKTSSLALLGFILAAPFIGATQSVDSSRPEEVRKNRARWEALPKSERDRIRSAYRTYRSYSDTERVAVVSNYAKFRKLPAERRRELTKKFEGLTPQQREQYAHKLGKLRKMGEDRRHQAVEFARMARSLTPEQRRQLEQLASPEEKRKFLGGVFRRKVVEGYLADKSAEERAAFQALSADEQKREVQRHFRERAMRGPPGERGGPK